MWDVAMHYATVCREPHKHVCYTHTRGTTMTLGILSRSKQNARQHGARTEDVRSTYGARTEHVGKNHEMRTPPLLKIRGYNIKTLITVESLHFVVFPNVLRTCSVRASYVLRTCSVRAPSHGWCWGQIAQICKKMWWREGCGRAVRLVASATPIKGTSSSFTLIGELSI